MDESQQLEQAIASLEAQRAVLGDAVVDLALGPLKEKLAALRRHSAAEQRRLVTVLFADLAGFTRLSEQTDPEDMREILERYFSLWSARIEQYSGRVEKYIGDAVMAVFGLAVAHEDDTENALRAALDMRQDLARLNEDLARSHGLQLAMRVGVHAGPVVASLPDEGHRRSDGQGFSVVGDTVNLASRLQGAAPEGGILISHDAYRYVRGAFDVQPLPAVQVKGKRDPVQVYLVQRAKARAFRMLTRGVEGVETRMVGRSDELQRLQQAARLVLRERELRAVTVIGEAGIGKSRLIYEFENWLELQPEVWFSFRGRAFLSQQTLPYSLARDLFAYRFRIQDSDDPETVRRKLEAGLEQALEGDEAAPVKAQFIGRLLGFQIGGSAGLREDPRQITERALAYLSEYFRTLAARSPVVILLEDIHWADDSSLDLLGQLARLLERQPVLIVSAARPALLERRPQWGEDLPPYAPLRLQPLSKPESRLLVEEILQKVEALPENLRELLVTNAEGNPFYIEELVRMLVEDGVILKEDVSGSERWRVAATRLESVRVPPTLTGLLQARLDSLAETERLLLQQASVIGRVFWDQAVEYLCAQAPGPSPAGNDVDRTLSRLLAREMVYRRAESAFEQTGEYLFKHALQREVAYESLLKRQRRIYHAGAARWLELATQRSQRVDEYAALIADHYEQAGELSLAAGWHRRAGEHAAAHFANAEAVFSLGRALDLTPESALKDRFAILLTREKVFDRQGDRQGQTRDLEALDRLARDLDDTGCRAEILLRRASLAFYTGSYPEAIAAAQQAIEMARAAGDREQEIAGLQVWGKTLAWQSEHAGAAVRFEQALALAREAGLVEVQAEVLWAFSIAASNQGDFARARELLQQSLDIYRATGDQSGESVALAQIGVVHLSQADYAGAKPYFESALRLFRLMGFRMREAIALNNLGVIAYEQGHYDEARRLHTQTLHINQEIRDAYGIGSSHANLGDVAREEGLYAGAQACYAEGLQVARQIGDRLLEGQILASLSLLHVQQGQHPAAIEEARLALQLTREMEVPLYEAQSGARLALALLEDGRLDEAEEAYRRALDLQRGLGLETNALESQAGLARIALARGRPDDALALVEAILPRLSQEGLDGLDDSVRVYLVCYAVLQARQDPRARPVLEAAYSLLHARAARIEDPHSRASFLENVPAHRELAAIWKDFVET